MARPEPGRAWRVARGAGIALALAALLVTLLWGVGALYFQLRLPSALTALLILAWGVVCVAAGVALLGRTRHWRIALGVYLAAMLALVLWWTSLAPSNERDWAADVAQMTQGQVQGSQVTLQNVRNFTWRSETDFDPRWETRHYDLDWLRTVDLFMSYWGSAAIAHTLVSFGFDDGQRVVFSVEIRKERHESFSELGGFFKEFEMSVIAADERDIIGTRTYARGEDVHLYPIRMPREAMRALFVSYVETANALAVAPRFYHTVTANCTTIIYRMVRAIVPVPADPRILLSGYLPGYLYKIGALDKRLPLQTWRDWSAIGERAREARAQGRDFSTAIRVGQPLPEPGLPGAP